MSLVEHAQRELRRAGVEPDVTGCLVATVGAFASYGHSGGSVEVCRDLLARLLRYEALTPLTADPDEWLDRSEISGVPMWQSAREPSAFSDDGGRTFYRLDEDGQVYTSVAPRWWILALRERDGLSAADAEEAIWEYLDVGVIDEQSRWSLLAADTDSRERLLVERWGRRGAAVARLMLNPAAGAEPPLVVAG